MLTINHKACHLETGKIGQIIGYGCLIINESYFSTLKVLVTEETQPYKKTEIIEDLFDNWIPVYQ